MKFNNQSSSNTIILGGIIFGIFIYVLAINILPSNVKSDSYYSKVDEEMTAKIADITYKNKLLNIKTVGSPDYICIKTTRTNPKVTSPCWKKIENNNYSSSIYTYKEYYIWLMDSNKVISSPTKYSLDSSS